MTCRFVQISFQCPRLCESTAPKTLKAQNCSEISRKTKRFLGDFITQVQKQSFTVKGSNLLHGSSNDVFTKGYNRPHLFKRPLAVSHFKTQRTTFRLAKKNFLMRKILEHSTTASSANFSPLNITEP